MSGLEISLALACLGLLITLGIVSVNAGWAPALAREPAALTDPPPAISLLIPARDEAATIGACLVGALAQTLPPREIIVLDDGSRDTTAALVRAAAAGAPHLRLISGAPLPAGWFGKHYACWQLATQASGDYLLFLDADTRLAPTALARLLALQSAHDAALVTVLPQQTVVTLAERLIVPLVYSSIYCLLPLPLVPRRPEPSLATGIGQLMCFRADWYHRIGGHAAVRDRVLDDVQLARRLKAAGGRLVVADGHGVVTCRMYDGLGAVWLGFAKNLYAFFDHRPARLVLGLLVGGLLWLWPWLVLPVLALTGQIGPALGLACLAVALTLLQRLIIARRFGYPVRDLLWHPLAVLLLLAITLDSARRYHTGQGSRWRGRPGPA